MPTSKARSRSKPAPAKTTRRADAAAAKRRLIAALVGGPLGLLISAGAVLAWLAADDGRWARYVGEPNGGTSAVATGLFMLAIGVGIPVGLVGAVLARRVRTARGAAWSRGTTAFAGAFLAGLLSVLPLAALGWLGAG